MTKPGMSHVTVTRAHSRVGGQAMSGYVPTTEQVREGYAEGFDEYRDLAEGWFTAWLDRELAAARREGRVEGMRSAADWLEGGTPRAWGFHHPCDPPGVRWEPNADERKRMSSVDAIREAADQIENGTDQ